SPMMRTTFTLNGTERSFEVPGDCLLLDLLRDAGLTGTKEGCGVGVCGACTVLVDGRPASACIYLAACAEGREVVTIEGVVERDPGLIECFVSHEALQCGICTPGQIVAIHALKRLGPGLSEAEVRAYLSGNLCRCTGYGTIVEAVMDYLTE